MDFRITYLEYAQLIGDRLPRKRGRTVPSRRVSKGKGGWWRR
jgi:hypothetical protein